MNLPTNVTALLQICSDGGDGALPNFMFLVFWLHHLPIPDQCYGMGLAGFLALTFSIRIDQGQPHSLV